MKLFEPPNSSGNTDNWEQGDAVLTYSPSIETLAAMLGKLTASDLAILLSILSEREEEHRDALAARSHQVAMATRNPSGQHPRVNRPASP